MTIGSQTSRYGRVTCALSPAVEHAVVTDRNAPSLWTSSTRFGRSISRDEVARERRRGFRAAEPYEPAYLKSFESEAGAHKRRWRRWRSAASVPGTARSTAWLTRRRSAGRAGTRGWVATSRISVRRTASGAGTGAERSSSPGATCGASFAKTSI
jgi:hypothetical protein